MHACTYKLDNLRVQTKPSPWKPVKQVQRDVSLESVFMTVQYEPVELHPWASEEAESQGLGYGGTACEWEMGVEET